jgi:DNA-damage-inducible protein J
MQTHSSLAPATRSCLRRGLPVFAERSKFALTESMQNISNWNFIVDRGEKVYYIPHELHCSYKLEEVNEMADSVVRSRIDPFVKSEADRILREMGITLSDGIRLFLFQVIAENALPFKVKTPNKKTIAAMEAARKGEVESVTIGALKREWKKAASGK